MSAKFWVRVDGPSATGPFGSDSHHIADLDMIAPGPNGVLLMTTINRIGRINHVIYPQGGWTRVILGKLPS